MHARIFAQHSSISKLLVLTDFEIGALNLVSSAQGDFQSCITLLTVGKPAMYCPVSAPDRICEPHWTFMGIWIGRGAGPGKNTDTRDPLSSALSAKDQFSGRSHFIQHSQICS